MSDAHVNGGALATRFTNASHASRDHRPLRWSRLACDAFVKRVAKAPPLTWASDTLNVDSKERAQYIAALKRADQRDYEPLIDYLATLNPAR